MSVSSVSEARLIGLRDGGEGGGAFSMSKVGLLTGVCRADEGRRDFFAAGPWLGGRVVSADPSV